MKKYDFVQKTIVIIIWLILLTICFVYKDEITVERIVNFTPDDPLLAAAIMLILFAVKSVSVFIYGGILYAASGILFPLPTAVMMNIAGTVVMTTIPFFIGKWVGTDLFSRLLEKNTKLEVLRDMPSQNEFFVSFFVRIVGILPSDLVGMYLGASSISYKRYIVGSVLGMLPTAVTFSIMGMSINDISSPAFILSACFEVILVVMSITLYCILRKRENNNCQNRGESIKGECVCDGNNENQHTGDAG